MTQLDMASQLTSLLIVFRADMTHVRQQFWILMQHHVVIHSSCSLRFMLAYSAFELVAAVNSFEVLVLNFTLMKLIIAQVTFE